MTLHNPEFEQKVEESIKSDEKAVKDFVINLFKGTTSTSELKFDSIKGRKQGHTYNFENLSLTHCKFEEYTVRQNQKSRKITFDIIGFSMKCCCKFSIVGPLFLKRQSINIRIFLGNVNLSGSIELRDNEIALDSCEVSIKICKVSYDDEKNERGGLKFLKKHVKIRVMKILKDVLDIDELVRKKLVSIIEDQLRRNLIDCVNYYIYRKKLLREPKEEKHQNQNVQPRNEEFYCSKKAYNEEEEEEGEESEKEEESGRMESTLQEENEILKNALKLAEDHIESLEKTKEHYKDQIIVLKKLFVRKDLERKKDEVFKKKLKNYFLNFYLVSLRMNSNQGSMGENMFSSKNELRKEFLDFNFHTEVEMLAWLKENIVM